MDKRRAAQQKPSDVDDPFLESLQGVHSLLGEGDKDMEKLLRIASSVPRGGALPQSSRTPFQGPLPSDAGPAVPAQRAQTPPPGAAGPASSARPSVAKVGQQSASSSAAAPGGQSDKVDMLSGIINRARAQSAVVKAAPDYIPPAPREEKPAPPPAFELRHLPPSLRVSELEEGITELLLALLQEERKNVQALKEHNTREGDASLQRSRRGPAEAELTFRRLTSTQSPFAVEKPPGVIEAELSSLATSLMSLDPMTPQRVRSQIQPSNLAAQVEALMSACQRQLSTVYKGDKNSVRALNAARGLGELLVEVERDCQSMALALAGSDGDAPARWAARLGSVSKTLRPTMPHMESLAHQLDMENELLREALKKPPPDALRQAQPRAPPRM